MTQKELAELLGISGAMVSRLVKRGMPTESVERAQRWRRRHLEPGRVKGSRFDPAKKVNPAPSEGPKTTDTNGPDVAVLTREVEALAREAAEFTDDPIKIELIRTLLRGLPRGALPSMPVGAWVALVDHVLIEDAPVRQFHDPGEVVRPPLFARMVWPDCPAGLLDMWLHEACDWHGYSVHGLPVFDEGK